MPKQKTAPETQDATMEEMIEPVAELDSDLLSSKQQTRNQAIRYVL